MLTGLTGLKLHECVKIHVCDVYGCVWEAFSGCTARPRTRADQTDVAQSNETNSRGRSITGARLEQGDEEVFELRGEEGRRICSHMSQRHVVSRAAFISRLLHG